MVFQKRFMFLELKGNQVPCVKTEIPEQYPLL